MEWLIKWLREEWAVLKGAPFAFVAVLAIGVGLGFLGADQLYTHELASARSDRDFYKDQVEVADRAAQPASNRIILSWTIGPPFTYMTTVDTSKIKAGDDFVVALIGRTAFVDIDEMADTFIAISNTYSITGQTITMAAMGAGKIRATPGVVNTECFYVVAIPKDTPLTRIHSLSDVAAVGGKIVDRTAMGIRLPGQQPQIRIPG